MLSKEKTWKCNKSGQIAFSFLLENILQRNEHVHDKFPFPKYSEAFSSNRNNI